MSNLAVPVLDVSLKVGNRLGERRDVLILVVELLLELFNLTEQLLLADLSCLAHLLFFIFQQGFEFVNDLLKIASLAYLL